MNPRGLQSCFALAPHSDQQKTQWYSSATLENFPSAGENAFSSMKLVQPRWCGAGDADSARRAGETVHKSCLNLRECWSIQASFFSNTGSSVSDEEQELRFSIADRRPSPPLEV